MNYFIDFGQKFYYILSADSFGVITQIESKENSTLFLHFFLEYNIRNNVMENNSYPTTHGLSKHPLYLTWRNIIKRCHWDKYKFKHRYADRGIIVCDLWRYNFVNFYNWAIENNWQKGLQIDRINNDGNYEPNNCRFVTSATNNRNRSNNVLTLEMAKSIRQYKINNPKCSEKEIAKIYNTTRSNVSNVLLNRCWREHDNL